MKYLKYFESSEDDFSLKQRNDLIGEIKYYFTDLEDIGYSIKLSTGSKLVQSKSSDLTHFDFNIINYIKCYIIPKTSNTGSITNLRLFMVGDLFKEVIDVATDRLSDKNLLIDDSSIQIDGGYISLNIYRIEDMDKIKKS